MRLITFCLVTIIFGVALPAQSSIHKFDGTEAFGFLLKQCSFGPRPVGSEAHNRTRDYLIAKLKESADSVTVQNFSHVQDGKTYALCNIIGQFGHGKIPGILLCAHWDTRPTADQELLPEDQAKPIMGADDGASGVAVLLEIAKLLHQDRPSVPVTIVFLDGEDFGPSLADMLLGARYFASTVDVRRYKYGVLLDMVGKRNLVLYREKHSDRAAGDVNDKIWKKAAELGYSGTFRNHAKYAIEDDHIPLIDAGLPCVDLIDLDYPYWHTLKDTTDKCSRESLEITGKTVLEVVLSERP
jgi:hypothetical protein